MQRRTTRPVHFRHFPHKGAPAAHQSTKGKSNLHVYHLHSTTSRAEWHTPTSVVSRAQSRARRRTSRLVDVPPFATYHSLSRSHFELRKRKCLTYVRPGSRGSAELSEHRLVLSCHTPGKHLPSPMPTSNAVMVLEGVAKHLPPARVVKVAARDGVQPGKGTNACECKWGTTGTRLLA
jgi:hypothetical protein